MEALTTEDVTKHFAPGDTVQGIRGDLHSVFKVMHAGYGFSGVLLTLRNTGNGGVTYCLWVVSERGRARCTMTAGDFAAADNAFVARIVDMSRGIGLER